MDGIEMCNRIKEDIRTSHIPLILLTAKASIDDKLEGLGSGADDYLYKPFNHHELIIKVHNMIKQRNKIREHFIKEMGIGKKAFMVSDEIKVSSMDEQFLLKAKNIVEEYMADPDFSVDSFAKLIGMSRSQLHRKLTALINLSPSGIIRSFRLNRAAQHLRKKSGTISEIAFDVGFSNLSYFSKCFQEQFGVLPSEYNE
jgi:AraC-like DNA-binding protein